MRRRTTPDLAASLYAGMVRLGDVEPRYGRWLAVLADGREIGIFPTRRAALEAIKTHNSEVPNAEAA